MEELSHEQKNQLTSMYFHVHELLVHQKKNVHEVTLALVDKGLDHETAEVFVQNVKKSIAQNKIASRKQNQTSGYKSIIFGLFWMILGISLTLSDLGAIFYGAIVVGLVQFIYGIYELASDS